MNTHTAALVLKPAEAAARVGVSVERLVALLRAYKYQFTELSPGARPGDRGRDMWGMTAEQISVVVRGQARGFAEPSVMHNAKTKRCVETVVSRIRIPKARC